MGQPQHIGSNVARSDWAALLAAAVQLAYSNDIQHPIFTPAFLTDAYRTQNATLGLLYCVKPVVLCFFWVDDTIHPEHFKYDSSDGARVNYIVGDSKHLYTCVIQHFSQPKLTVLDLTTSHSEGT